MLDKARPKVPEGATQAKVEFVRLWNICESGKELE